MLLDQAGQALYEAKRAVDIVYYPGPCQMVEKRMFESADERRIIKSRAQASLSMRRAVADESDHVVMGSNAKEGCLLRLVIQVFAFLVISGPFLSAHGKADNLVRCGVAKGYPPYQYVEKGRIGGFDTDVLRLLIARMGADLGVSADHWDNVFGFLRVGQLDCVAGMEINEVRKKYVLFTRPYYRRYSAMFVRDDREDLKTLEDLQGFVITGDRQSFLEEGLVEHGGKNAYRILQTDTKEDAIMMLKEGSLVHGSIMPVAVGSYLAARANLKVRVIEMSDPGTLVAFAVRKDQPVLRDLMDSALAELLLDGTIAKLYSDRFGVGPISVVD